MVARLLRDPKVVCRRRLHCFVDHPRRRCAVDRAAGSAGAESADRDAAAGWLCRRRAGISARHRRARPRRAVAGHLRHAGFAHRRLRCGRACLPDRLAARPARRLSRQLGRRADFAAGRHLDGVPAGAALDPAGRHPRHRPAFGDHRHRRHRLDAVLPRGAHRDHGAGADGLCGRGPHHRLLASGDPVSRNPSRMSCRC